jgi:hypothetical protein
MSVQCHSSWDVESNDAKELSLEHPSESLSNWLECTRRTFCQLQRLYHFGWYAHWKLCSHCLSESYSKLQSQRLWNAWAAAKHMNSMKVSSKHLVTCCWQKLHNFPRRLIKIWTLRWMVVNCRTLSLTCRLFNFVREIVRRLLSTDCATYRYLFDSFGSCLRGRNSANTVSFCPLCSTSMNEIWERKKCAREKEKAIKWNNLCNYHKFLCLLTSHIYYTLHGLCSFVVNCRAVSNEGEGTSRPYI